MRVSVTGGHGTAKNARLGVPRCSRLLLAAALCLGAGSPAAGLRAQDAVDAPAGGAGGEEPRTPQLAPSFDDVRAAVQRDFPDLISAGLRTEELVGVLLGWAEAADASVPALDRARARLLAAEILDLTGDGRRARALWVRAAGSGEDASTRARGLFELGLHYFQRERYRDVNKYWKALPQLDPESPWIAHTGKFAPFLEALGGAASLPDVRGRFGAFGEKSLAELRGRWVLLDFWSSAVPDAQTSMENLRVTVDRVRNAGWDGQVLGINLDRDRAAFEQALEEWLIDFRPDGGGSIIQVRTIDWPQHHDGLGFDSPIVTALGVPRVPMHWLVDPEGRLRAVAPEVAPVEVDGRTRYRYETVSRIENAIRENLRAGAAPEPRAGAGAEKTGPADVDDSDSH